MREIAPSRREESWGLPLGKLAGRFPLGSMAAYPFGLTNGGNSLVRRSV